MLKSKNAILYATLIAVALIIYFILLNAAGLGSNIYLSFFNAVITAVGLVFVIKNVFHREGKNFDYMDGFKVAVSVGFLSTFIFTVFMAVYLTEINRELATAITSQISTLSDSNIFALLFFILLSGFATTLVSALVILPIYKQSWNTKPLRKSQDLVNQK